MPVVRIKCVVSGLANMTPSFWRSALKRLQMNPTHVRILENRNHKVILADCISEREGGNLDKERLGSGGNTVV